MSVANNSKAPFKDRVIPWYFVMVFVVVFAVNGLFVYLAVHTHTGVVTEDAYEKGLAYDDTLAQAKAQQALGWKADIVYDDGTLQTVLRDAAGAPLKQATVTAFITRPTQDGMDQTLLLAPQGEGVYAAPVTFGALGQWDIGISVICKGQQFQAQRRIIVE